MDRVPADILSRYPTHKTYDHATHCISINADKRKWLIDLVWKVNRKINICMVNGVEEKPNHMHFPLIDPWRYSPRRQHQFKCY